MRAFEYDVAFSLAGEDREYVGRVAEYLKQREVQIFYDYFEQTAVWGKDLLQYLDDVYHRKARFCVMFISEHYARSRWATHESQSAQARAFLENEPYILPARFDDTVIPGIRPTVAYLDLRKLTPTQCGIEILRKIGRIGPDDEPTRDSWESYGWLFDVDGYRVPYIPLVNDWRTRYVEKTLLNVEITPDGEKHELPTAFRAAAISADFVDKPSCRLSFYSLSNPDCLVLRLQETSYGDYLRSGEHLDDPVPHNSSRTYRDDFGRISRSRRTGDLRLFPLTNICGVGLFVLTHDDYLIATTHSLNSHVYPGRKTFSSSGTMKWGAFPDPFTEIVRKTDREINHLVNIRSLRLVGFGADARKLYFQFSFLEAAGCYLREIKARSSGADLFPIPFSLEEVSDALFKYCWEPAAEATLLTLCANRFGRDAVARTLSNRSNDWGSREMLDEWDYRSSRPGLLPDMSVRYPIELLKSASDEYLDHAFRFMGGLRGSNVLEIGAGTGRLTERLISCRANVTSIELSSRMVARLRARLAGFNGQAQLTVLTGFAQNYLPMHGYDCVICSLVLIHNVREADFAKLVKEMCASADRLFVFEDITEGRKTSPHTILRPETALVDAFADRGFVVARRDEHMLFSDKIVFLDLRKGSSAATGQHI